jgi:large subunit ribosomal protein L5
MVTLLEKYKKDVIPAMKDKFGYTSPLAVPRIEKVVLNTGFGRLVVGKTGEERKKTEETISNDLQLISGQKPVFVKAKQSIATFKLRKGMVVGARVTLREKRMYDFLERLINIALPRSRDFHGINPKVMDKQGNLTVGIREHIAFPEILPEKAKLLFGFEITVVTTAKKREEGLELLRLLGFPIKS